MIFTRILICLCFSFLLSTAYAADDAAANPATPEQQLLIKFIKDGQPELLDVGGKKTLTVYKPALVDKQNNAVLLLSDEKQTANWPELIGPMRRELPQLGWATLSIGLPPQAGAEGEKNDAAQESAAAVPENVKATIKAGIAFLKEKGAKRILLLGYGVGAAWGAKDVLENKPPEVKGLVLFSLYFPGDKAPEKFDKLLLDSPVPVLEFSGGLDYYSVSTSHELRKLLLRQRSKSRYEVRTIAGADHSYAGYLPQILKKFRGWSRQFN